MERFIGDFIVHLQQFWSVLTSVLVVNENEN
jgi:hypothetical protein